MRIKTAAGLVLTMTILLAGCQTFDPIYHMTGSTILDRDFSFTPPGDYREQKLDYGLLIFKSKSPDEKVPLLLTFHGAGSTGQSHLFEWEAAALEKRIMVVAPSIRRIYERTPQDLEIFYALVEHIAAEYPIDRSRIYIAGVSAGGIMAEWAIQLRPSFWKGGVLLAYAPLPGWAEAQQADYFPPLLWIHGEQDPVFPVENLHANVGGLQAKGVPIDLRVIPETGHTFPEDWAEQAAAWMDQS